MKATLTLDFSDRLNPDEQRELLVEALRLRRQHRQAPQVSGESPAMAA